MRFLSLVIAVKLVLLAGVCSARVVAVGTQSESPYRDTEVVNFAPKTAAFMSESGACFADLGVPSYLFCSRWNLAKVTRRGADATAEWCRIDNAYRQFVIQFR